MSAQRCLYVTSGWGVHDDRWVRALQSLGFEPTVFSLGRDALTVDELRVLIEQAATSSTPILAGPLTTITRALVGIDAFLVGLSWGFDMFELEEDSDLSWLSHLDGLIVEHEVAVFPGHGVLHVHGAHLQRALRPTSRLLARPAARPA